MTLPEQNKITRHLNAPHYTRPPDPKESPLMTAQLHITLLPSGELRAELPAINGSRRASTVSSIEDIKSLLLDEQSRIRDATARKAADLHTRVFTRTALNHDIPFATRTIGSPPRGLAIHTQPVPRDKSRVPTIIDLAALGL